MLWRPLRDGDEAAHAGCAGRTEVVKELLAVGVDVNTQGEYYTAHVIEHHSVTDLLTFSCRIKLS